MARQPFNTRWAQGVESDDSLNSFQAPNNDRLITGWEGGQDKDAPPAGQENWWHNRVDSALQGVERNGVMDWHPQAIYGLGAPTYGSDGNYYESLSAGNAGNDPTLTTGFWRYSGATFFSSHEPGFVQMVAHNGIPSIGWLKCNGALLTKPSYQRLFAAIGTLHNIGGETSLQFRLPDYRGEFIRGFDDGRGVDPGREFGGYQSDALQNIIATLEKVQMAAGGGAATGAFQAVPWSLYGQYPTSGVQAQQLYNLIFDASTAVRTANETRPRNKTASYWIKY
ncbi:MAG: phage tail protein [Pseudomonadota bacterium]|nr:phage tail protein [Pseudomonadota bacterium]